MANYATLKAAIAAAIKQNGNNEITGNLLQQQLLAMVNSLGVGYQYAGIATTATNPGTPDQNVFYLASTAGTYTNFNGLVLTDGEIAILKYNGAWSKDSTGAASLETVNQLSQEIRTKDCDDITSELVVGQWRNPYNWAVNIESGWASGIIDVQKNDVIVLYGVGGGTPLLYATYNEFKKKVRESGINETANGLALTIGEDEKYILVNVKTTSYYSVFKRNGLDIEPFASLVETTKNRNLDYLFRRGYYINNSGVVGGTPTLRIVQDSQFAYAVVECTPGEKYILKCTGGVTPRAYAFLDENNAIVSIANGGVSVSTMLIVPQSAKYLTINANVTYPYSIETNPSDDVEDKKDVLNTSFVFPLLFFNKGYYAWGGNIIVADHAICSDKIAITSGKYRLYIPNWKNLRLVVSYWVGGEYRGRLYDRPFSADIVIDIPDCEIGVAVIDINDSAIDLLSLEKYTLKISKVVASDEEKDIDGLTRTQKVVSSNVNITQMLASYINGLVMANELENPIAVIDGVGATDRLHHTPSFCIVNDKVYFVLLGSDNPGESGTDLTMRIILGYFNLSTPTDITYIIAFQNGETYAGYDITYLDACSMVYLGDGNGCHIYVNAGNSGENLILHRYFDFSTLALSAVDIPNISINGTTVPFVGSNIAPILTDASIGTRPQMQILCPNSYDGKIYGSYSGYGGDSLIIRTQNGTLFEYISTPTFEHSSYCETTVANISENLLAVMIRQGWNYMCQRFSFYHIDTGKWDNPIDIIDPQSRVCAFQFGANWYFLHNSGYANADIERNRYKHQLLLVDGNVDSGKDCLKVVKEVVTDNKKFYYFVYPYNGVCYIMYVNNRQSINFCSVTIPDTYSDLTIRQKLQSLLLNP